MENFENQLNASVPAGIRSKRSRVESKPQSRAQSTAQSRAQSTAQSRAQSTAQSTTQSTIHRNYQKYKPEPEQYDSDVDDDSQLDYQLEEVAIDEKLKLIDLKDGSYYIPCCSKIESRDEKKGGLLLLMNAESDSFNNVIVSYRYVRLKNFLSTINHIRYLSA